VRESVGFVLVSVVSTLVCSVSVGASKETPKGVTPNLQQRDLQLERHVCRLQRR
jgi:hypothetical protein